MVSVLTAPTKPNSLIPFRLLLEQHSHHHAAALTYFTRTTLLSQSDHLAKPEVHNLANSRLDLDTLVSAWWLVYVACSRIVGAKPALSKSITPPPPNK